MHGITGAHAGHAAWPWWDGGRTSGVEPSGPLSTVRAMTTPAQRLHSILVEVDEEHGCGDLPDDVCLEVPGNATRIVAAQTLQSIGDRIVDAKTVLP